MARKIYPAYAQVLAPAWFSAGQSLGGGIANAMGLETPERAQLRMQKERLALYKRHIELEEQQAKATSAAALDQLKLANKEKVIEIETRERALKMMDEQLAKRDRQQTFGPAQLPGKAAPRPLVGGGRNQELWRDVLAEPRPPAPAMPSQEPQYEWRAERFSAGQGPSFSRVDITEEARQRQQQQLQVRQMQREQQYGGAAPIGPDLENIQSQIHRFADDLTKGASEYASVIISDPRVAPQDRLMMLGQMKQMMKDPTNALSVYNPNRAATAVMQATSLLVSVERAFEDLARRDARQYNGKVPEHVIATRVRQYRVIIDGLRAAMRFMNDRIQLVDPQTGTARTTSLAEHLGVNLFGDISPTTSEFAGEQHTPPPVLDVDSLSPKQINAYTRALKQYGGL